MIRLVIVGLCFLLISCSPTPRAVREKGSIEEIIQNLSHKDPSIRITAMGKLIDILEKAERVSEATPVLLKLFPKASHREKLATVFILRGIGPKAQEAIPLLLRELNNEKNGKNFRCEIMTTLARIDTNGEKIVLSIIKIAKSEDGAYWFQDSALKILGRLAKKNNEALKAIIEFAIIEKYLGQGTAIDILRDLGPRAKAALPLLRKMLQENYNTLPVIKLSAAEAIYKITKKEGEVLPFLLKLLSPTEGKKTLSSAISILSEIKPPPKKAIPQLIKLFQNVRFKDEEDTFSIKDIILLSLAEMAPKEPRVESILVKALSDKRLRWTALRSLKHIFSQFPNKRIADALIKFYTDRNSAPDKSAAKALLDYYNKHQIVLSPETIKMLKNPVAEDN